MWPVRVAIFVIVGYLQSIIWLSEYPCVETSSLQFLDHCRLQTWEPVSMQFKGVPVRVFQNLMHLSAVPGMSEEMSEAKREKG